MAKKKRSLEDLQLGSKCKIDYTSTRIEYLYDHIYKDLTVLTGYHMVLECNTTRYAHEFVLKCFSIDKCIAACVLSSDFAVF